MVKAVIDRIEDGEHAVLLIGDEEEERILPIGQLPFGAKEGTWLNVFYMNNQIEKIEMMRKR